MEDSEMAGTRMINVEVACATPEKQRIVELSVPYGTCARTAVEMSAIQGEFPQLDISGSAIGVFGEVVQDDHLLEQHDRVEIYRPLLNDPRDARRSLAARGSTMGVRATASGAKRD
jgi:putative ubiquitin-RnfH superfamily antitoxin RatB of RatAB toxin-antitoxin module